MLKNISLVALVFIIVSITWIYENRLAKEETIDEQMIALAGNLWREKLTTNVKPLLRNPRYFETFSDEEVKSAGSVCSELIETKKTTYGERAIILLALGRDGSSSAYKWFREWQDPDVSWQISFRAEWEKYCNPVVR